MGRWVSGSVGQLLVIGHWSLVSGIWLAAGERGKMGICPVHEGTRGLAPLSILGQAPGFGGKLNSFTLQGVKVWLY